MITTTTPLLSMEGITKTFPGVTALDHVDFSLKRGEIHALLGENGAGKSTLMKVLSGMYQPDSGRIVLDGVPISINAPGEALDHGIGMVYQNFTLSPELTVLENIVLGTKQSFFQQTKKQAAAVQQIVEEYGLQIDLSAKVWQLSVGEQQRVEIIKCFYRGARLLILDEPTSVLTPPETEELFAMMRRFVENGCSLVFISHKLGEVLRIADRVTVFRKGRMVGSMDIEGATEESLTRMMVGRSVDLQQNTKPTAAGEVILSLRDVCAKNDKGLLAVDHVSLDLCANEICGIAAVSGNGQAELAEVITGIRKAESGEVVLNTGEELHRMSVRQIINAGVGSISEKRLDRSLIPGFSIAQNLIVKDYRAAAFRKGLVLNRAAIRAHADEMIEKYDIAAPDCEKPVRMLSGGNLQKVVLARELSRTPRVIVAANPTYGLDVSAIEFVQQQLIGQRDRGAAILLISEELDEVLRLSDRIAVFFQGRIVSILEKDAFDREAIGRLMTGGAR